MMIWVRPDPGNPHIGYTLAAAAWMAIWWISEAVPLAVTSLLPVVLFPTLGIMDGATVSSTYFNHVIFLFIGGFMVAMAMQKWNLHRRIALNILALTGTSPQRILLGFMLASAFLSMWISNTATAMMMVPIALSVISELKQDMRAKGQKKSDIAILLGIAYGCSIGGIMTLVGTPPNLSLARIFQIMFPQAPEIGFAQWMMMAMPVGITMLLIAWGLLILIFGLRRNSNDNWNTGQIRELRQQLGPMSRAEFMIMTIFLSMAFLWISRSPIQLGDFTIPGWSLLFKNANFLNDGTVAIALSIPLFMLRVTQSEKSIPLLDWETAVKLPWGIVLLFGGGFALASGFSSSGLALWMGEHLKGISTLPLPLIILSVSLFITFLTELTSNTATTEMILPVLAGLSVSIGVHPLILMIPATLSASMAFMLPVATPPNAIIFGSGQIRVAEMVRAGIWLNLAGAVVITLAVYLLAGLVFGFDPSVLPEWGMTKS